MMTANYTIIIVKSESWYAGYVKELPGTHSQGKTIDEVKENLKEAINMILESNYSHFVKEHKKVLEKRISLINTFTGKAICKDLEITVIKKK